jgi:hypothetical protein
MTITRFFNNRTLLVAMHDDGCRTAVDEERTMTDQLCRCPSVPPLLPAAGQPGGGAATKENATPGGGCIMPITRCTSSTIIRRISETSRGSTSSITLDRALAGPSASSVEVTTRCGEGLRTAPPPGRLRVREVITGSVPAGGCGGFVCSGVFFTDRGRGRR